MCSTVASGQLEAVKRLLQRWPQALYVFDYDKRTALHIAAMQGDLDMVCV